MSTVTTIEKPKTENAVAKAETTQIGLTTASGFELAQRVATGLSKSSLVPKEYQNNLPNCLVALNMANRIGADPLMVMQNLYVVHGRPGWSSQFLIATFNQCGRFSAMRFQFSGTRGKDDWGCRAWAIEKDTGERLEGSEITIALAKAEGWYTKNGSKWKTMPEQMLMYRAAAFFVRAYAPELAMGLQTREENEDIVLDATPSPDGSYAVHESGVPNVLQTLNSKLHGNGEVIDVDTGEVTKQEPAKDEKPETDCPVCGGSGYVGGEPCGECDGTGKV